MNSSVKYTIQHMQRWAQYRNGWCLSEEYWGMEKDLKWKCEKGHTWDAPPRDIWSGYWCPACSSGRKYQAKYTIEDMQFLAKEKGGECLSDVYINKETKLKWKCKSGHVFETRAGHIILGNSWCPECSRKKKGNIEEMRKLAATREGKCLSRTYTNRHKKLKWECSKGHRWYSAPHGILKGNWCPVCAGKRMTIKDAQDVAKKRGGICLSGKYINNMEKMIWQCSEGHIWEASYKYIKNGSWCPHYLCRYKRPKDGK